MHSVDHIHPEMCVMLSDEQQCARKRIIFPTLASNPSGTTFEQMALHLILSNSAKILWFHKFKL